MSKLKYILFILFIVSDINHSYAKNSNIDCSHFNNNQPFQILLKANTDIKEAILSCIKTAKLKQASVTGELTLLDPVFGYFVEKEKKFHPRKFPGNYEVAGFSGNFNLNKSNPKLQSNIHAVLFDKKLNPVGGGHLISGIVGVAALITIYPLQN